MLCVCFYVFSICPGLFYPGQIWSTGRRVHSSRRYVFYVFKYSRAAYVVNPVSLLASLYVRTFFVDTLSRAKLAKIGESS
jgi:hypothetical protein